MLRKRSATSLKWISYFGGINNAKFNYDKMTKANQIYRVKIYSQLHKLLLEAYKGYSKRITLTKL